MVHYNATDTHTWCGFFVCVADYPGNTISYIRAFSRGLSLRDDLSLGNGKGNIFLDINSWFVLQILFKMSNEAYWKELITLYSLYIEHIYKL